MEPVGAAAAKPAGALDAVADFGADPTGHGLHRADAGHGRRGPLRAQGKAGFVPQNNCTLYGHVLVDGVTVQGAGP
ncbi:hypothetical protein [Streptomyces sp. NPDC058701]|uniref:hypothetical protein n=1 Tax=Streptomyces sp. NPDC058701 TaxID=3346608 RepID=UPI003662EE00